MGIAKVRARTVAVHVAVLDMPAGGYVHGDHIRRAGARLQHLHMHMPPRLWDCFRRQTSTLHARAWV